MSDLSLAIQELQAEVDAFGQGTKTQPKEGSPEWYILRAKSCGLSMLKVMEKHCLPTIKAQDTYYKAATKYLKLEDTIKA